MQSIYIYIYIYINIYIYIYSCTLSGRGVGLKAVARRIYVGLRVGSQAYNVPAGIKEVSLAPGSLRGSYEDVRGCGGTEDTPASQGQHHRLQQASKVHVPDLLQILASILVIFITRTSPRVCDHTVTENSTQTQIPKHYILWSQSVYIYI